MTLIFPQPKKALDLLVQRIFMERVKPAIERLLERGDPSEHLFTGARPPPPGSSPFGPPPTEGDDLMRTRDRQPSDALQERLLVTAEVYKRTRALIDALESLAPLPPLGPLDLSLTRDGLFGPFLSSYPQPELWWLSMRYQEEVDAMSPTPQGALPIKIRGGQESGPPPPPPQPPPPLVVNVDLSEELIRCHGQTVDRSKVVAPGPILLASCVKATFLGPGPFSPRARDSGSLLQLLAEHLIDGIEVTMDLCGLRGARERAKREVEAEIESRKQRRYQLMISRYEAFGVRV